MIVRATLLAWLSMIGFDFLIHGGLLASLYSAPSDFLLPAEKAFALIPFGYLSFLLLAWLLVRLMRKLELEGGRRGFLFGLEVGGLIWAALALGLASISTARIVLLLGWFAGQTLEMGVAGYVAGHALESRSLKGLTWKVVGFVILCLLATVVLQNTGLVNKPGG